MENTELKASIKKLWDASKERRKKKTGLEYAYEVGIQTGLQGLAYELELGDITLWEGE